MYVDGFMEKHPRLGRRIKDMRNMKFGFHRCCLVTCSGNEHALKNMPWKKMPRLRHSLVFSIKTMGLRGYLQ